MLRDIKTKVFYPYSPEQVWQAIANRRALAAWLMENDFEPRVGHKFRFQAEARSGFDGTIYCEVIEIDEPRSLSYTWRGSFTCKPTIVTWRLLPVKGGTQLQIEHTGFDSEVVPPSQPAYLYRERQSDFTPKAMLETRMLEPVYSGIPLHSGHARLANFDGVTINFYLSGGWHAALNSRLQNWLAEMVQPGCLSAPRAEL